MQCKDCIHLSVCEYTHQALPLSDITYDECDHVENIGCPFINKQDVKPVIHAKWERDDEFWWCSNCDWNEITVKTNYCSHCGAKMDM